MKIVIAAVLILIGLALGIGAWYLAQDTVQIVLLGIGGVLFMFGGGIIISEG